LNQARSIMVESTINFSWICTWVILQNLLKLCVSQMALSQMKTAWSFWYFQTQNRFRNSFYTKVFAVTNSISNLPNRLSW